jgi:hydrogenase/urease accessory protein HupE
MHRLLPLFFLFAFLVPAHAHEVRPGYIEITEVARDSFDIVWKQPVRSAGANAVAGLGLRPVFPENCARLGDSRMRRLPGALVEKFSLTCYGGLFGQSVGVEGLQRTITDVLVQLALIEGGRYSLRLTADAPVQTFSGGGTFLMAYFGLGVEHLVLGLDHILFVLGLVLLVQGWRSLIWVITAFTVAHSLTLGISLLTTVQVSGPVVEAIIALSILFVAIELTRAPAARSLLASRYPQSVAFVFGLLHGFGFAGVLSNIGVPRDAALPALGLFNLGIEVGQLMIVAACLLFGTRLAHMLDDNAAQYPRAVAVSRQLPVLLLGGLSVYWLIDRSLVLLNS